MKLDIQLEDIRRAAGNCLRCDMCTYSEWPDCYTICPVYNYDRCFSYSGGGYMYLARNLVDKKLTLDKRVIEFLYTCPGCLACDEICKIIPVSEPYVRPFDIIRLMRHEAVKQGLISKEELKVLREPSIRYEAGMSSKDSNVYGIPETIYDKDADKVLFVESSFLNSHQGIYQSLLRIFEKIGDPISAVSDDGLNLPELYDLGFWEEVEAYLSSRFDVKGLSGRELIFLNPHSQEFISKRCPEIIPEFEDIETRHVSEIILNALKGNRLQSKKESMVVKISYHDPCYLGRGLNIYDPPRDALSLIDGVELIEMQRNRKSSFCCGARARDNYFRGFSKTTAIERLNEFKRTDADLLITACPHCKDIFQEMMHEKERDLVQDLTMFIEERIV